MPAYSYDPFRRHDQYGRKGAEPQPLAEQARLAAVAVLLVPFKLLGCLLCLVSCYLTCRFAFLLPSAKQADWVAAAGKVYCRLCLFCLGFVRVHWVRVPCKPQHAAHAAKPGQRAAGIVSNHCGWADILVHMAHSYPSFVARDSTARLIWVGLISKSMDCVFVERENKTSSTQGTSGAVKARMQAAAAGKAGTARPMLLFPEGTTTNGHYLLPFKSGAFLAGAPVQPVILQYDQGRVSPAWESMDALRHILLVLCNWHSVTAYELPVYAPDAQEQQDPQLFATHVREYMLSYQEVAALQPTTAKLDNKRAYHRLLTGGSAASPKKVQ